MMIAEDDITNLDDFQCYVKLSLGGRRLPVFSLNLDAPPSSDAEVATTIRLCSQQRDARPVGAVDRLIQHSRMRQQLIPGTPRASRGRRKEAHSMDEQPAQQAGDDTDESVPVEGSARKRRKRGGSSRKQSTETVPPAYQHIMYDEEEAAAATEHEEPEEESGSDG